MVATTGRSPLYRTNPKPVLLKFLICVLGLVMANASGRAEAPTAPQPSTLPAARALDELPGSDELGKLQAALAQIKENLERRNLTAAELQGLREQIAPLSDSILAALQRLEPRLAGIKERLDQLGPKSDAKASPESPAVAAERASQQKNYSDISEVVKQARRLAAEAEQTRTSIDAEDLDKLQVALAQNKRKPRTPQSGGCRTPRPARTNRSALGFDSCRTSASGAPPGRDQGTFGQARTEVRCQGVARKSGGGGRACQPAKGL